MTPTRSPTKMVVNRLSEIERIAWLCTPDWDDWCGNASDRVSAYLTQQGIKHTVEEISDWATNWPYGNHTFIRLSDGTVLDTTITQYRGEGHRILKGGLSTTRTGVFPIGHPQHRLYQGSRLAYPDSSIGPVYPRKYEVGVREHKRRA